MPTDHTCLLEVAYSENLPLCGLLGTAQTIFACTPLWTALFAAIEVGEPLQANECLGGAIITLAVLMAAYDGAKQDKLEKVDTTVP